MQTEGLTHADSVLQPPFRGNCLNWVLGHILVGRNRALLALGRQPLMKEEMVSKYATGSEPILRQDQAMPLEELLALLDSSQEQLAQALVGMSLDQLSQLIETDRGVQLLGVRLDGLHWHETYHTGQLELLRQLAGTNDAIV